MAVFSLITRLYFVQQLNFLDYKSFRTEKTLQEVRPIDFRYLPLGIKLLILSDQERLLQNVLDLTD